MSIQKLVQMLLSGALAAILAHSMLRLVLSETQSFALGMWAMLLVFWLFVRDIPQNRNIHFGIYAALALLVSAFTTYISFRL